MFPRSPTLLPTGNLLQMYPDVSSLVLSVNPGLKMGYLVKLQGTCLFQ